MIVVTGMHRSGTSMTTALLSRLGAPFGPPEAMIAADRWNESGYFENKQAVGINLRLLLGLGVDVRGWINPPTRPTARLLGALTSGKWRYLLPPSPATLDRRAAELASEISAFDAASRGLFVKDPRFAVTYGIWHKRAAIEGTVFCFRHPDAVGRSVAKRDLMPGSIATRLWLRHNRGFAEALTGDEPVLLVDYDRFFTDSAGEQIERIASFVSRLTGKPADAANALTEIDMTLRHHSGGTLRAGSRETEIVHSAFRAVSAAQGEPQPARTLRAQLEAAGLR